MNRHFMALALAATVAASGHAQTGPPVTWENGYWVQTVTGEFPVAGAAQGRISTRGAVTVSGGPADRLSYTLRKRLRAPSESEARRVFAGIEAGLNLQQNLAHLRVSMPNRNIPLPEIEVACPRNWRHCLVSTAGGAVRLGDLEGDVEAVTGGGGIHADRIGGSLIARTGGGEIRIGTVGGTLRCVTGGGPILVRRAGGESWFDTGGGEILVEEAGGPVHASTGAGNIEVLRGMASVSARTAGGQIRVLEAGGVVSAESAGGGIQVEAAPGVKLESVGGGIKLRGVSGELRASTAVGSILAELLSAKLENSYLSTGSGDVTVFIPSNLAVTVQAQNDSPGRLGRIVSDFPEVRIQTRGSGQGRVFASGAINGGGPRLMIAASNGTIFLRRQK